MNEQRIHRAVSDDGTEIRGRVVGQGPPLVLVHGSLEDGDLCWDAMLPHLRQRFTCYLMSTRSRGLSGATADLEPQRRLEDVTSFVESIGEPVHLFGESDGGALALGTAARTSAVSAVAAYEPTVFEVADDALLATLDDTIPRIAEAVAEGRTEAAARTFSEVVANEDELAALTASGYFQEAGRYMPVLLEELEQDAASGGPGPTDAAALSRIGVPALLLHGSRSALYGWFARGVHHVAEHVADATVREVDGAGHFGVALEPRAIAEELTAFFAAAPTRV